MKNKKNYILIFYLIFCSYPDLVFSKEEKKNRTSQLIVEADESIEWFEKDKYYLAKGNVVLKKDGLTLKANLVKATYLDENGENIFNQIRVGDRFVTPSSYIESRYGRVFYTPTGKKS